MPIYEFFCPDCNTVFNFYSPSVNTNKTPACPKCQKRELERLLSKFAFVSGKKEEGETADIHFDEAKMEGVLQDFEREIADGDEEDPRKMAGLLRKFNQAMGGSEKMEEVITRMEAGEDPDNIAEEMGEDLMAEDIFSEKKKKERKSKKIIFDETLYEL